LHFDVKVKVVSDKLVDYRFYSFLASNFQSHTFK